MNTLSLILSYNSHLFNNGHGATPVAWPFLVGPTGCGKSARAYALAQALKREFYKVNLLSMENTEVLGIPRFSRLSDGTEAMRRALPAWAQSALERPTLLLIDEADKARPDNWSVCLDFLADLTIDNIPLRKNLVVVLAGQPVDSAIFLATEEGRALTARVCWVPIDQMETRAYVSNRHRRPEIDFLPIRQLAIPYLPEPTERQLDWLAGFHDWLETQPLNDDDRKRAIEFCINGMIAEEYREKVRQWLTSIQPIAIADCPTLLEILAQDPERVWKLPLADCYTMIAHGWQYNGWTKKVLQYLITRVCAELSAETLSAMVKEFAESIIALQWGRSSFTAEMSQSEKKVEKS
jgi:hypothetical protein